MSETVWVSLSSAKMYIGVQAWVHMFFLCSYFFCCLYALPYQRMYIHAYILLDALRQLALPPGYLCICLYTYPVLLFIFLCIPLFVILFNIILLLCTPYYTDKIKHFLYIFIYFFYLCFKQKKCIPLLDIFVYLRQQASFLLMTLCVYTWLYIVYAKFAGSSAGRIFYCAHLCMHTFSVSYQRSNCLYRSSLDASSFRFDTKPRRG